MHRTARFGVAALALLALSSGLAACGDDENDEATATYCEKTFEIETIAEPDIDFEHASEEEIATGVKAFANDTLLPLAEEIRENAPDEVSDDIEVLVGAVEQVADTGDFEAAFENDKVEAASDRVHDHDVDACDWAQVDVTAKDYAFEGIDDELDVGATSFEFSNKGKEVHEMALVRKNEGVTESFEELLQLPEDQSESKVTFVAHAMGAPGDDEYVLADLKPGEYIALCFISVGTTSEDQEVDGPPHFTKGMKREFTVS
jgi:hypothetical protein